MAALSGARGVGVVVIIAALLATHSPGLGRVVDAGIALTVVSAVEQFPLSA
jgi:hypothetical protein